jgi:hypothetical protein
VTKKAPNPLPIASGGRVPAKETMPKKYMSAVLVFLYGCATLQFIRYYCKSTDFYLNMTAYLTGRERLPFQERVLPILLLKPMYSSQWLMGHLAHRNGAFTPELGPVYALALVAVLIAGIYTQKLYGLVSSRHSLSFLVYPIFLFAVMWTYAIHSEADFAYPYDLPGVAFFAAGLYYIYKRSYAGLFLVILIGTFNRETTLFLIGIYVIDSASRAVLSPRMSSQPNMMLSGSTGLKDRFDLRLVSWGRVAVLAVIWASIKLLLTHHFARNSNDENFLRIEYNLRRLNPRLLPALLNICGYTLPLVLLFYKRLKPIRFQNYLWIVAAWLPIMFCSGVLVETRIYGELCPFAAVALVLIIEESATRTKGKQPILHERSEVAERMVA